MKRVTGEINTKFLNASLVTQKIGIGDVAHTQFDHEFLTRLFPLIDAR